MTRTRIGSDAARAWVRSLRLGNPYAKSILLALSNYVNDDGTAFPGLETLNQDTEIAVNTIIARLRWCETIGAITVSKCWIDENGNRNKVGRGRPTSWEIRFLLDADIDAIATAAHDQTPDRELRGAAKLKHEEKTAEKDDTPEEVCQSPGHTLEETQPISSQSVANHLPITGASRILESESEQDSNPQTPFREKAERGFESKIDEEAEKRFQMFRSGYPDGIVDIEFALREFFALPVSDQIACVAAVPVYADRCRKRREKSMKAHLFVRKRGWDGLLASVQAKPDAPSHHPPASQAGHAILNLGKIIGYRPLVLAGKIVFSGEITPQLLALAQAPPENEWLGYGAGAPNRRAWLNLGRAAFKGCALPELTCIHAPWPWPPRKDGSINLGTTDPPKGLSDDDARALAGM